MGCLLAVTAIILLLLFIVMPGVYFLCLLGHWTSFYVKDKKWQPSPWLRDFRYYGAWSWLFECKMLEEESYESLLKNNILDYTFGPIASTIVTGLISFVLSFLSFLLIAATYNLFGLCGSIIVIGLILCALAYYPAIRLARYIFRLKQAIDPSNAVEF